VWNAWAAAKAHNGARLEKGNWVISNEMGNEMGNDDPSCENSKNLNPETMTHDPETRNLELGTWNSELRTQNLKPGTRNY